MASAGGNDGRPPPQRPPLRLVRIPLPRLPAGQRVVLRFVPGQAAGRGNPGVQPHVHVMRVQPNPAHQPRPPQPPQDSINSAVRQQAEQLQRRAEEEHRRREQLKARLTPSQPPQVTYSDKEGTAELSWQPVGPAPSAEDWQPEYCVLLSEGDSDPHQVYRGHMTSCTVACDLLCPGHTYNFTVAATADEEQGERSPGCSLVIPALPPSPPLPPRVGSRAKTSLTLRWSAPSKDNGSAITLYSLEWDQCGRGYVELYSGKGKQFKFNNRFPPGSQALFRLRARNEAGWSTYSNPLEFSAGAGPPSTPHPPTLTQAGVHHLALEWAAPTDSGSPITAFCLEMEDPDSGYGFRPVYQGEEPYCTCSSLQRATGYNFRLSATNDRGTSSFSHPITHRTLPDVPGQPPGPTLKDRPHCTVLNITWRAPEDDGGSEIHSFLLQLDDEQGGTLAYQGPDTCYLAEGLSPGRTYQCRVCACSEGGQGAWSSLSRFQTPPTIPHPPRALRLLGRPTQTSVTVEWDRPETSGGAAITSYSLEVRRANEGGWQAIGTVADPHIFLDQGPAPLSPPALVHTIEHLLPGEDYELQVTCQNSVGTSRPSTPLSCTMAPGPPDPPTDLEVTYRTASSAQLKWQPSVERGCPATSCMLELSAAGAERQVVYTDSTSSHVLRALRPATSYTVRLKAQSKAGPSDWTPPTLFSTTPSTPAQPLHFSMVSCTHTSLLVGWAVPESNGAPVTGYHIEVNTVSGRMATQKIPVHAMETQQLMENLQPSTKYRLRVQAENAMGQGPFSPYIVASTLHPPPPPPTLALVSCTTQSLKVAWGRKQHKGAEYLLQMAQQGRSFRTVYRGSSTAHKATRLQTDTEYICRAAAISQSGQGAWSEHVTFKTLPSPPLAPTELVLRQVSDQELLLSWSAVDYPLPLTYEVQVRTAKPGQDFQQAYKGVACSCSLEVRSHDLSHEARVRAVASCDINGQEEVLWGTFAHPVHCLCKKLEEEVVGGAQEEPSHSPSEEGVADGRGLDRKLLGFAALVFVSVMVFAVAVLLGQNALQQ